MKTVVRILGKSLIILTFLYLTQIENLFSQKGGWIKTSTFSTGIEINEILNGSGHGLLTNAELILKIGHSEIDPGVFTQNKTLEISGFSFKYKYYVTSGLYTNLYAHYSFMYHYNNCLNDNLNEIYHPQCTCGEFEKFNTMTHHVGIGVETMVLKNFYIDTKIGIGGYFSKVCGVDMRNNNFSCRDDNAFSTMASIGILYRLSSKAKKQRFGNY